MCVNNSKSARNYLVLGKISLMTQIFMELQWTSRLQKVLSAFLGLSFL